MFYKFCFPGPRATLTTATAGMLEMVVSVVSGGQGCGCGGRVGKGADYGGGFAV